MAVERDPVTRQRLGLFINCLGLTPKELGGNGQRKRISWEEFTRKTAKLPWWDIENAPQETQVFLHRFAVAKSQGEEALAKFMEEMADVSEKFLQAPLSGKQGVVTVVEAMHFIGDLSKGIEFGNGDVFLKDQDG